MQQKQSNIIEKMHFDSMPDKDYYLTEFRNCSFSNIALSDFSKCKFVGCDLSNCTVSGSSLQEVSFTDCKLMGIIFYDVNDFGFSIHCQNCILDYCSFDNKKTNTSSFKECRMHGVSFNRADINRSKFVNCDLLHAVFLETNIKGIDFKTNSNLQMDLSNNLVKKTKFSPEQLHGLLSHYDIIIE
ncbi:pentapeptide repeat-containing protein [Flavobacterium sp. W1B]|uniref:pentapeptide repeat-containing protein n=1 Tax=Flavobacterium sp. W1B TaxID=3394146 RepID=UPI0039BC6064